MSTTNGLPLDNDGLGDVCDRLGVAEAEIWALMTVETRGFGFLADRRPALLFERHIFHRITEGRHDAHADISNKTPGGYRGGAHEHDRLAKAAALNEEAALQSASWGIGQIMGFNFKVAGYQNVQSMVAHMEQTENAQLLAVANFIHENGLAPALRRKNWASFARAYNGRDYKRNEYDTRLAAAHAKFSVTLPDLTLRTAQAALLYAGHNPGPVDGLRGRQTRAAVAEFQEKSGLPETGDLDAETERRLLAAVFGPR